MKEPRTELKRVLHGAPENLAAIRGLAEIYHRQGRLPAALALYQSALDLAKHDPDLEHIVDEISQALTPVADATPVSLAIPDALIAQAEPPALPELEKFLDAIHTYRQRRAV